MFIYIPLPMWLGDLFKHKKIPSKHTRDIILFILNFKGFNLM